MALAGARTASTTAGGSCWEAGSCPLDVEHGDREPKSVGKILCAGILKTILVMSMSTALYIG